MDIEQLKAQLAPVFARYGVRKAALFGSTAREETDSDSDIDILVDLPEELSLVDVSGLKLALEDTLGISVDLVEYSAVKPAIKERVMSDHIPVYETG